MRINREEANWPAYATLVAVIFIVLLLIVYKFPEVGGFIINWTKAARGGP